MCVRIVSVFPSIVACRFAGSSWMWCRIGSCFSSIVARRFGHSCWIWVRIQSVFSSVACRFAGSCWMWVRIESVSPVLRHVDLQVLVECWLELGVSFQLLWHVDLQVLVECGSELECFSSIVACTFAGFVAPFSSTMPIQYWPLLQNVVLKHNRRKVCLFDDW